MGLFSGHKLNERQISILKNANLPTEWKKLNYTGRQCITAIEEMLQYLDKKYGKTFCYNGYVPENKIFLDQERLYAYAEGDDPDIDTFTVERDGKGFKDGYQWVLLAPGVQKEMEEKLSPILEGQKYKMFTELSGVSEEGRVKAIDIFVYVDNSNTSETDLLMGKIVNEIKNDSIDITVEMYDIDNSFIEKMEQGKHQSVFTGRDAKVLYHSSSVTRKNVARGWERNDD